eukprot:jgi/Hompol1/4019/HPOL_006879-RA
MLLYSRPNAPSTLHYAVVKVSNITWDINTSDILAFFGDLPIPVGHVAPHYHHGVHVIMDRQTNKTRNECFVEFPQLDQAQQALRMRRRSMLKGRPVIVEMSSQEELITALFPSLTIGFAQISEQHRHFVENEQRLKAAAQQDL